MGIAGAFCLSAAISLALQSTSPDYVVQTSLTGADLARMCSRQTHELEESSCNVAIWAATDALSLALHLCPPERNWTLTSSMFVRQYVRDHPELWDKSAAIIIRMALKDKFGCVKK